MSFVLPDLPYDYAALEPHFDEATMRLHHTKHHQGYVTKLNAACERLGIKSPEVGKLCREAASYGSAVMDHAGGHWNHTFFWESLSPRGGGVPKGGLFLALSKQFGSFEKFKEVFEGRALGLFGSGWTWLCRDAGGRLHIVNTANQRNPLMEALTCDWVPLLGVDVWEHAYYLKYQNRRAEYVKAFFEVVNWEMVGHRFERS